MRTLRFVRLWGLVGRLSLLVVGAVWCAFGAATLAQAQDATIPRNPDAELLFEQALSAFEQGDYATAHRRFRLVIDYPLNRKTTAALLMDGKALYRMERYDAAIDVLETLQERYPETTYRDAAREVLAAARDGRAAFGATPDTLRLGVLLPMRDEDALRTQALFNGIRLAVDEHNGVRRRYVLPPRLRASVDSFRVYDTRRLYSDSLARADGPTSVVTPRDTLQMDSLRVVQSIGERPRVLVRMFFRETDATPATARAAAEALIRRDRVDAILGPLYSREARAAGAVAEREGVVMMAPLATEESVSAGREYVFQANPTLAMRGRVMARFAAQSLLIDGAGIIHEASDDVGAEMAQGFRDGARAVGLPVPYTLRLPSARGWSRLSAAFEADSTITDSMQANAEAVYMPISGRDAKGKIQDALAGLQGLGPSLRPLGNSQWHDLSVKQAAGTRRATYANDFYVDRTRPAVQRFIRHHRMVTGQVPSDLSATGQRLAYTGYDTARFLLHTVPDAPRLGPNDLRRADVYEGLGVRIDFQRSTVNEALFFHRYRNGRLERLQ